MELGERKFKHVGRHKYDGVVYRGDPAAYLTPGADLT